MQERPFSSPFGFPGRRGWSDPVAIPACRRSSNAAGAQDSVAKKVLSSGRIWPLRSRTLRAKVSPTARPVVRGRRLMMLLKRAGITTISTDFTLSPGPSMSLSWTSTSEAVMGKNAKVVSPSGFKYAVQTVCLAGTENHRSGMGQQAGFTRTRLDSRLAQGPSQHAEEGGPAHHASRLPR